jgi:hypothetical protein
VLSQALKLDPQFLKGAHDFQYILARAAETIQPPNDECITWSHILERLLSLRAQVFHTLDLFGKNLLTSCCIQGVQLQLKMLLLT